MLVAIFNDTHNPHDILARVKRLAAAALESDTAFKLEVAKGSTKIYIIFTVEDTTIMQLVIDLRREGAVLTFIHDPNSRTGFYEAVGAGRSLSLSVIVCPSCCK